MDRSEIEAKVTDAIIARLEAGVAPWTKPWTTSGWLPTSLSSGKAYRGINPLILSSVAAEKGYGSPLWGTFKQVQDFGGKIRKGEKATPIVFWKILKVNDQQASKENATKSIPLLRYFNVFNVEQADGLELPPRFAQDRVPVAPESGVLTVIDGYIDGPDVTHVASERAFYSPTEDKVVLPLRDQFAEGDRYAGTVFHELVHSTGHRSRLDRFTEAAPFGCATYAKEELVAEIGATLLGATVGVKTSLDESASYVASWLRALEDDRSLVIKASQQAQKAVDRILNHDPSEVQVEEETRELVNA
jgi:antirestriction protein ArdC